MSKPRLPSLPASRAALAAVLALAACCAPAAAQTAAPDGNGVFRVLRLNDTGLMRCTRDARHFTTDCAGTGQDAEFGRDVTAPAKKDGFGGFAFRKVCNSGELAGTGSCSTAAVLGSGPDDWGCTYDKITQLTWEVKTTDGLRADTLRYTNLVDGSAADTSTFVAAVNTQGLCGASDWRLPTTHELQGIVDFDRTQPSIDERWFPQTQADHYWTSEPYFGQESTVAWVVSFLMDPSNVNVTGNFRADAYPTRLVRSTPTGAAVPAARFAAVAADEVADTKSHLVWKRCIEGMQWDGTTCTGNAKTFNFLGSLQRAQSQATRTGEAWRVPNAKELFSIADLARGPLAIDPDVFPGTPAYLFWTSTAFALNVTGAWALTFDHGHVLAYVDSYDGMFLRLVRDGP